MIKCSAGEVRDLSLGGVRVECRGFKAPESGAQVRLTIEGLDRNIELEARVKWVKKTGFRGYELGLEFVEVPGDVKADLVLLARSAAQNGTYERAEERRRSA